MPLNVAENIGFVDGWKANQRWTQQLLKDVGLEERGDALPKELSGGMAQRVAIARGLYGNPKVLLLDEPFSAVDAFTRMRLQDLVISLIRQYEISILLVTHDLDEAIYLSDRVIILGGQPSRIVSEIKVPVAHPRDRRAASLAYLRGEALSALYQHQTLDTTIQPTPHTTPQGH
jgi:sulfonate transport system ATP-binding protein